MKNLLIACFMVFSFEEAFSQTGYKDADRDLSKKERAGDEVVTGQSSTSRRTYRAGELKDVRKSDSIKGINCVDDRGVEFAPNSAGHKKCVDNANRIR